MECGHDGVTVAMTTEGGFPQLAPTPSPAACQLPSPSPDRIQTHLLDRNVTPRPVCVTSAAAAHSLRRGDGTRSVSLCVMVACVGGTLRSGRKVCQIRCAEGCEISV